MDYTQADTFKKVSIVIPLHNEAENIKSVALEVLSSLTSAGFSAHIYLIDDGSTDSSLEIIAGLSSLYSEISYVSLSRNFGKEAAIMAGLEEARDDFDVLAYMDSDGQHTSTDLINLIRHAQNTGADIVCGVRKDRTYQTRLQRVMTETFYKTFHALSDQKIDRGAGDFNVLRPNVVKALRELKEEYPFIKGLIAWVGFHKEMVPITIQPRSGGQAKSSTNKMLKLAFGAILSFSAWPLRAWTVIGASVAFLAMLYLVFLVLGTLVHGRDVPGFTTIVALILWFGGIQLLSVGIIGEYIARIYEASKKRPRYIVAHRSKK